MDQITDDSVITNIPEDLTKSRSSEVKKDPRKVAAGKKMAERNAERRKNTERKKKESPPTDVVKVSAEMSTIFYGIQKLAVLVASGFTLYHGYNFFYTASRRESTSPQLAASRRESTSSTARSESKKKVSADSDDSDFFF